MGLCIFIKRRGSDLSSRTGMRGLNPGDQLTDGQYGMASMRGGAPGGGAPCGLQRTHRCFTPSDSVAQRCEVFGLKQRGGRQDPWAQTRWGIVA
jgi:hypothetical protein